MPTALSTPPPLRELRTRVGLDTDAAAARFSEAVGRQIKTDYFRLLEHRGTRVHEYIKAFSKIYNVELCVVEDACERTKNNITN